MITAETLSRVRTALINLNGRDLPILMLATVDDFTFGVVKDRQLERYLPFSMKLGHGEPIMWDDRGDTDPTEAMWEICNIFQSVLAGNRDDPHP